MIRFLVKIIPKRFLILLYKKLPFPINFKRLIIYRANKKFLVAVLGIIKNEENKILLLNHTYRKAEPWGIPSGYIENENPGEGLKREIFEETNFVAELDRVIHTEYCDGDRAIPPRINIYFSGRIKSGIFKPCDEISGYNFAGIKDLPEYMPDYQKALIKKFAGD